MLRKIVFRNCIFFLFKHHTYSIISQIFSVRKESESGLSRGFCLVQGLSFVVKSSAGAAVSLKAWLRMENLLPCLLTCSVAGLLVTCGLLDCGPLPHWLLPSCFRSWLRGPLSSTSFLRISFLHYTCHLYVSCISDPSLLLFNLLLKYTFKSQNLKCSAWWIFTGNTFGTTSKRTIYY